MSEKRPYKGQRQFSFMALDIPIGATLQYVRDPSITVKVSNYGRDVSYADRSWTLSELARHLLNRNYGVRGTAFFTYKGVLLSDMWEQKVQEQEKINLATAKPFLNDYAYFSFDTALLARYEGSPVTFWAEHYRLVWNENRIEYCVYDVDTKTYKWLNNNIFLHDFNKRAREHYILHFDTLIVGREFDVSFVSGACLSMSIDGADWEQKTVDSLFSELQGRKDVQLSKRKYEGVDVVEVDEEDVEISIRGTTDEMEIALRTVEIRAVDLTEHSFTSTCFLTKITKITKEEALSYGHWVPYAGSEVWGLRAYIKTSNQSDPIEDVPTHYNLVVRTGLSGLDAGALCSVPCLKY